MRIKRRNLPRRYQLRKRVRQKRIKVKRQLKKEKEKKSFGIERLGGVFFCLIEKTKIFGLFY